MVGEGCTAAEQLRGSRMAMTSSRTAQQHREAATTLSGHPGSPERTGHSGEDQSSLKDHRPELELRNKQADYGLEGRRIMDL